MKKNKEVKKKNRDAGAVVTKIIAAVLVILMLAGTVGGLAYYLFTRF